MYSRYVEEDLQDAIVILHRTNKHTTIVER